MQPKIIYNGSKDAVEFPGIRKDYYNKDFYFGFYCTLVEEQAKRFATRFGKPGVVSIYKLIEDDSLNILKFEKMNEEWLDFIINCRSGNSHNYDIVEGPMADDTIFNYIQDYIDGRITRTAFWELAKFRYPTHQISFHTIRALDCIKFEGSYVAYEQKK